MPEGFEKQITEAEFIDLLEFLSARGKYLPLPLEKAATMLPQTIAEADPAVRGRYEEQIEGAMSLYGDLVGAGIPGEDARFVFPNATRTNLINWFISVRTNWPNTILFHNNWGSQVGDGALADFYTKALPDMLCFDTYPWQAVWDSNQPNHTGPPIGGPPTGWYGDLRRYREHAKGAGIPLGFFGKPFMPFKTMIITFFAIHRFQNCA